MCFVGLTVSIPTIDPITLTESLPNKVNNAIVPNSSQSSITTKVSNSSRISSSVTSKRSASPSPYSFLRSSSPSVASNTLSSGSGRSGKSSKSSSASSRSSKSPLFKKPNRSTPKKLSPTEYAASREKEFQSVRTSYRQNPKIPPTIFEQPVKGQPQRQSLSAFSRGSMLEDTRSKGPGSVKNLVNFFSSKINESEPSVTNGSTSPRSSSNGRPSSSTGHASIHKNINDNNEVSRKYREAARQRAAEDKARSAEKRKLEEDRILSLIKSREDSKTPGARINATASLLKVEKERLANKDALKKAKEMKKMEKLKQQKIKSEFEERQRALEGKSEEAKQKILEQEKSKKFQALLLEQKIKQQQDELQELAEAMRRIELESKIEEARRDELLAQQQLESQHEKEGHIIDYIETPNLFHGKDNGSMKSNDGSSTESLCESSNIRWDKMESNHLMNDVVQASETASQEFKCESNGEINDPIALTFGLSTDNISNPFEFSSHMNDDEISILTASSMSNKRPTASFSSSLYMEISSVRYDDDACSIVSVNYRKDQVFDSSAHGLQSVLRSASDSTYLATNSQKNQLNCCPKNHDENTDSNASHSDCPEASVPPMASSPLFTNGKGRLMDSVGNVKLANQGAPLATIESSDQGSFEYVSNELAEESRSL